MRHRGRAALQRRVQQPKKQPGFSPRGSFRQPDPPRPETPGFGSSPTGEATTSVVPHSDPRATVEERRFTVASRAQRSNRASAPRELSPTQPHEAASPQNTLVISNRAEAR